MTFPPAAGDAGRALLFGGLLVAGCAGGPVFTSHPRGSADGLAGIPYSLPMTLLDVELTVAQVAEAREDGPTYEVALGIVARRVPDPDAGLLLVREDSAFRSDDVSVALSESGLLRTVNATSLDQSAQVVQAVARALLKAAEGRGIAVPEGVKPADELIQIAGVRRFVLPLREGDQEEPLGGGWSLLVRCRRAGSPGPPTPNGAREPASDPPRRRVPAPTGAVGGVVVRPPEAWVAEASLVLGREDAQVWARTALALAAPDFAPWVVLPMDGAALVEVKHRAAFEDGVLVRTDTVRPGTALAVASAPYEIVEGMVALPAGILQLKIDLTQQSADLADERRRLSESLRLLAEELEKSRTAAATEPQTSD